jgi:hypothetical protein
MMRSASAIVAAAVLAAGCTAHDGFAARHETARSALAEARPAGEPVSCVTLARVARTKVHGDGAIDFHLHRGYVLRNTLPHSCPGLAFEQSFSYRVQSGRLCSTDLIRVNHPQGLGATCAIGRFQPLERTRR